MPDRPLSRQNGYGEEEKRSKADAVPIRESPDRQRDYDEDEKLLRQYVQSGSSTAFDRIVRHHLPFVFSVCLREVHNVQMAEDAAQVVFLILMRKAVNLRTGVALTSWLFQTSCFVCKDLLRQERRRRQREERAAQERREEEMQQEHALWSGVEPLLNDLLSALNPKERAAILLRFFEGLTLRQTGNALGLSEDAARMKVSRALDKMRRHLEKAGIVLSAAALAEMLDHPLSGAVPAERLIALASKQGDASLTALHSAHLQRLSEGVLRAMRWHQWKSAALTAGGLMVVLIGFGLAHTGATPHFGLGNSFLQKGTAQQQAEETFHRVSARLAQAQTVSGRVLQQSFGQSVPLQFKLMKPNLYAVVGKDAEFHYDGQVRWSYAAPIKQAVNETGVSIRTVPLLWGFDPFLSGESGLYPVKRYTMESFGETQAAVATLDVPGETEFKVFADPKSGLPLGWSQQRGEILIRFRYVGLTFDAPMQSAEFAWTPPADATPQGQPLRPPANLPIGAAAPDFEAQTPDGRPVRLSEALKGKKGVLLNFWIADHAFCQEELSRLESRYTDLQKRGIALLSVNCGDTPEAIRNLVAEAKFTFPIVRNGIGVNDTALRYHVYAYPTLYLIGPDGKVRGKYLSIQENRLSSALNALTPP